MSEQTNTTGCECKQAGYCKRHHVEKPTSWFELCQTRQNYFQAWEAGRGPGQRGKPSSRTPGVGYHTKRLLRRFLLTAKGGCGCGSRAAAMDRRGPDWCESHIDTIVGWMRIGAKKRKLPFSSRGATLLIRLAIHNARRDAARLTIPPSG